MKTLAKMKILSIVLLPILIINSTLAQSSEEIHQKAQNAIDDLKELNPDMQRLFDESYGYVVFPSVGKGAMGFGGAHGKGVVFEQGEFIGYARLTQISWGLQAGGQAYREVIFFETEAALKSFKDNNFELAAQVSAVAVTAGVSADAAYENGVAVYTMTKGGLMYEASIGGQKFKFLPEDRI